MPLRELVMTEVVERMRPRQPTRARPLSGYSDGEFSRIVKAARSDVVALRKRLDTPIQAHAGEAAILEDIQRTGYVPFTPQLTMWEQQRARLSLAEKIFATRHDVIPMLVLLVASTGWNVEVIKDLPHEHNVIDGLAVSLEITKRRRGAGQWHQTVTWEIGPPGRELHTPGGVYLLLHRLMAPARNSLAEPSFWAVWSPQRSRTDEPDCRNPFSHQLSGDFRNRDWTEPHDLRADAQPGTLGSSNATNQIGPPLGLNFNRLKTSVDVRRTRQLGGHLPSAARSNSVTVLFRNYLSGDQSTIEWAQDVMADTLVEVETAALDAHHRLLEQTGRTSLQVVTAETARTGESALESAAKGSQDAAWSKCVDHNHHPITGRRCSSSFLDCFSCGNCLVTGDHLPGLLGLLDALDARRHHMDEAAWWKRYGPTWAAIRHEVLPKFSPAEVAQAEQNKPTNNLLDLVEPRWEHP
ncbi:hypothetical protein [Mycobacterium sp. OTB74]|uniref:hypothetical protein n=1 Tax=Mycobacterium sp. OTB74 TaxID=1853452 RepID=UPI00247618C4|nr:hypothetical protein [Mycobacterium sp. OTB74]